MDMTGLLGAIYKAPLLLNEFFYVNMRRGVSTGVVTATPKMSFATPVATTNQSKGIECSENEANIMELRDFD